MTSCFRRFGSGAALAVAALIALGSPAARAATPATAKTQAPAPADPGWPRFYEKDGNTLTVYQPQVTSWEKYRELKGAAAFELKQSDAPKAIGVVNFTAKTVADTAAHTVTIKKISIDDVRFAALDEEAEKKAEKALKKLFPKEGTTVSLDRVLANLERTTAPAPPIEVKNDPPTIFVMNRPAVLLFVDGEPVYAPIEGTSMKYVVNTNWDLFWNETTSHYYLLEDTVWRTSQKLDGDWVPVRSLPADMSKLPSGENFDDVKKLIPPPAVKPLDVKIVYTNKPAEIVVIDGTPVWVDIAGTNLAFVKNSDADFFLNKAEGQYYYLVSGRWFRAKSTEGPWTFATPDLPEDFRKIPPKGPKASVLASVPGTSEAADAVLLAQIPTTVVVNKAEAANEVKVRYNGEPQFAPIADTTMSYATNTQDKVVKLNELYYLCYQGVWFVSKDAKGPWTVLDSVPDAIYTIPTSSPLYNVTYVKASNPTDTTVEYSYTSGYMGSFVVGFGYGSCVMWGTGWYYPPYYWYGGYYPVYWPYPYAYGYGAWYNSATGRYGYGGAVYGPYGMAGGAAWYNSSTGRYGRMSTVQTPWGGRTWSSSYNPYTGVASARAGGWNAYGSWGSTAIARGDNSIVSNRVSTADGTVRRTTGSNGGAMTKVRTDQGTVRVGHDADNNVYAGKDGNVYKRDQGGNWSKYENGGWQNVDKPQRPSGGEGGTRPASDRPSRGEGSLGQGGAGGAGSGFRGSDVSRDLNRDASSRSRGSEMSRSYGGATRSWSGGTSRGGGGFGGGGGRGGGGRR
jgi:hypothetical protein